MAGFEYKDGILHADGVNLRDLAETIGTPAYIYSESAIENNIAALKQSLGTCFDEKDMPLIAFACKANSNLAVLGIMARNGLGTDIVSGGELVRALRAGITADKIIYSGVGKSETEIYDALSAGIFQINVESKSELERIARIAAERQIQANVALRFNPDVDADTHAKITTGKEENKFGLLESDITGLFEWAATQPHLTIKGLSVHIGSQLTSLGPYEAAFKKTAALAQRLTAAGHDIARIDVGGGLGIVYQNEKAPNLDEYARLIKTIIAPHCRRIILEPGRMLTGNAGILLSRIMYIKETTNRRYMILDAGMNDLMRPALYEAYHDIRPVTEQPSEPQSPPVKYDIVGPVCETGDTFGTDRQLPAGLKESDLVALMSSGAYGAVMGSNYNTRPLPPEILVRGTTYITVRQRQTLEDILKLENLGNESR